MVGFNGIWQLSTKNNRLANQLNKQSTSQSVRLFDVATVFKLFVNNFRLRGKSKDEQKQDKTTKLRIIPPFFALGHIMLGKKGAHMWFYMFMPFLYMHLLKRAFLAFDMFIMPNLSVNISQNIIVRRIKENETKRKSKIAMEGIILRSLENSSGERRFYTKIVKLMFIIEKSELGAVF
uniref:Uncharacterized protein n=1 Tax=Glossina brevipalpis TaxID=37001 RepID=A0A1A9WA96_9MUSC